MTSSLVKGIAVAASVMFAQSAYANSFTVTGVVVDVDPTYTQQKYSVPDKRCELVQVPIYGEDSMNTEGAIIGGIIGGIVGNKIGSGGGREAATGVGALTGAIIGGKGDKKIVGYQNVEQCTTAYTTEVRDVFVSNMVRVKVGEEVLKFYSKRQYQIGDTATIKVTRDLK